MLAPIVTKEMKLFPTQSLPPRVKNVRSRAQSLQDFANGNAVHVTSLITSNNTQTALLSSNARTVQARSRNSQSIGSLPINTVQASGYQNVPASNAAVMIVPTAKSPPKYSTSSVSLRKQQPLDSIAEGIELPQDPSGADSQQQSKHKQQQPNQPKVTTTTCKKEQSATLAVERKNVGHRSSHDGISDKSIKMEHNKRAERTHSMEGGRNRKKHKDGKNPHGCFAMWLTSKFRKGNDDNNDASSESTTSTTTNTGKENK